MGGPLGLPAGFVLDEPPTQDSKGVPEGFVLDQEQPLAGGAQLPDGYELDHQPTPPTQVGTAQVAASGAPATITTEQAGPSSPSVDETPSEGPEIWKGFYGTAVGQNPRLIGRAMEAAGRLFDHQGMAETGRGIAEGGAERGKPYAPRVPGLENIDTSSAWNAVRDFGSFAGYNVGQAVGSSLPSIGIGLGAAALTANPAVGLFGGVALASLPQNWGEVYDSVINDKDIVSRVAKGEVGPKELEAKSLLAAIPMAALDAFGVEKVLGAAAFKTAKEDLVKRVMKASLKGGVAEGATEGMQEVISQWIQDHLGSQTPMAAKVMSVVNNAVGGAIGGGVMSGAAHVVQAKPTPLATPEAIADAYLEAVTQPSVEVGNGIEKGLPNGLTPLHTAQARADAVPQDAVGPLWYSPLRNAVEERGPNAASPEQWLATLRATTGVKEEELDAMGVPELMSSSAGKKITKDEFRDYLAERAIQVQDVTNVQMGEPSGHGAVGQTNLNGEYQEDAKPLYEQYTIPGARERYGELHLTVPSFDRRDAEGNPPLIKDRNRNDFLDPHFLGVVNSLARVRYTVRRDVGGNRLLVLDEIQGDAHQSGRKAGYRTVQDEEAYLKADKDYSAAFGKLLDRIQGLGLKGYDEIGNVLDNVLGRPNSPLRPAFKHIARDLKVVALAEETNRLHDIHVETARGYVGKVPDLPFKTSWQELISKRMIRWAADNGIDRIAWSSPETAKFAAGQPGGFASAKQEKGMQVHYGVVIPSIMRKWAKRLGGTYGITKIGKPAPGDVFVSRTIGSNIVVSDKMTGEQLGVFDNRKALNDFVTREYKKRFGGGAIGAGSYDLQYITIPPRAATEVRRRGMPMFAKAIEGHIQVTNADGTTNEDLVKVSKIVEKILKSFGMKAPVNIIFSDLLLDQGQLGSADHRPDGSYLVKVYTKLLRSPEEVYAILMHEVGHVVMWEMFSKASDKIKLAIQGAYDRFLARVNNRESLRDVLDRRDNAVAVALGTKFMGSDRRGPHIGGMDPEARHYWTGFDEWFAEQVARWATSSEKPLGIVDEFFQTLGTRIRELFRAMLRAFQGTDKTFSAAPAMKSWLDSFIKQEINLGQPIISEMEERTRATNQTQIDKVSPGVEAAPQQTETQPIRDIVGPMFNGNPPPKVREAIAWADKFSWFYKYMLSLPQVAARNRHLRSLQRYLETIRLADLEKTKWQDAALRVNKRWRGLGRPQADAVSAMLDDLMHMTYLSKEEQARVVRRQPTAGEFATLVKKHGLGNDAVETVGQIRRSFDAFITAVEEVALREAQKITNQANRIVAIEGVRADFADMRKAPYFPAFHFGNHTITIRDAAGNIKYFTTVERRGLKSAESVQKDVAEDLQKQMVEGDTIKLDVLPEDAQPMLGMSPQLLKMMDEKLELSEAQKNALEMLRFRFSPTQNFKHRFQGKKLTPGYSTDFMRAFATFFFHGSNYYSRVKYADDLRGFIAALRKSGGVKRGKIANYVANHYKEYMDPKKDWTALRSLVFLWALGYSPAAATLNLTQMMVTTYPYLASNFGDIRAVKEILSAGGRISSFYKRGKYEGVTEAEFKAIGKGIREGIITEAMAPDLAGMAEGNNLLLHYGNATQQVWSRFMSGSAKLFELTEQMNRRITFRAAWNLAMKSPENPHIARTVDENQFQYDRLLAEGWTKAEAAAFVVAANAVQVTQYEYGRAMRPRFTRGKLGTLFVFKTFLQNTLFFLWNHPRAMWRSALIMAFMGGALGLPGGDDLKKIIKALAWQLFGKDLDLEREARRFILDVSNGTIPPDLLLHGMARRGMGIPLAMDMLGAASGSGTFDAAYQRFKNPNAFAAGGGKANVPMYTADRSRSIGLGNIIPFDAASLFGPPDKDASRAISDTAQQASGAAYGTFFNIYKALADTGHDWNDPKRWERAVPRFLGGLSKAYSAYSEGMTKNKRGAAVVRYDPRDPEQMAEILGLAMGYQPLRQQVQWDAIIAVQDAKKFWDVRSQILYRQFDAANRGGDEKEKNSVVEAIRKFNADLPSDMKDRSITEKGLVASVKARARARESQEAGIPTAKQDIGLSRSIRSLFPESVTDVRKVPQSSR